MFKKPLSLLVSLLVSGRDVFMPPGVQPGAFGKDSRGPSRGTQKAYRYKPPYTPKVPQTTEDFAAIEACNARRAKRQAKRHACYLKSLENNPCYPYVGAALPGQHYCRDHQGNASHYDKHNCVVCQLEGLIETALANFPVGNRVAKNVRARQEEYRQYYLRRMDEILGVPQPHPSREEMARAVQYRSGPGLMNEVYLGSLATARLYSLLGFPNAYGSQSMSLLTCIQEATDENFKRAWEYKGFQWILRHYRKSESKLYDYEIVKKERA